MKKKLVAIGICLVMSVVMLACGSTVETSVDLPDTGTEEVQDGMSVPEGENAEVAQEIPEEVVEDDPESWTDDTVIAFPDADFKEKIQRKTGVTDRDITYGDVKHITTFDAGGFYLYECDSLDVLKYFDSLQELKLVITSQNALSEIGVLSYLKNLEKLYIYQTFDNPCFVDDISAIGELNNLRRLVIRVDGIGDFTPIYQLENLQHLELNCVSRAEFDLSQMASLENMEILELYQYGLGSEFFTQVTAILVKDVSCLSKCQNMYRLSLAVSGECDDLSALVSLSENCDVDLRVVLEPEEGDDLSGFVSVLNDFESCVSEKSEYEDAYDVRDMWENFELWVSLGSEGVDLSALRSLSDAYHHDKDINLFFRTELGNIYLGDIFKKFEYINLFGDFDPQILENCEFPSHFYLYINDNERLTNLNFLLTSTFNTDGKERGHLCIEDCDNLTDTSAADQVGVRLDVD